MNVCKLNLDLKEERSKKVKEGMLEKSAGRC
jgi:hypothetical protein